MARHGVFRHRDARCSRRLGLAVAFEDGAAERDLQKVEYIYADRRCSSRHDAHVTAQDRFKLVTDDLVVELVVVGGVVLQVEQLFLDGARCHVRPHALQLSQARLDLVVDSVVDAWNGREQRRLEHLAVIGEFQHVTAEITDFRCADESAAEKHLFERVC